LKITNRKRAGRVAQVTERLSSQIKKKKKKEIKKKGSLEKHLGE
jgi:hypothetical protein